MSTIRKDVSAVDNVLDRLHGMKFQITPEEHQLLGITQEDIQSFTEPEPGEGYEVAIQDIINKAYMEVPQFNKMVTEDHLKDPQHLPRAAKLVGKFLKHLKSLLPPNSAAWIKPDTYTQGNQMVLKAMAGQMPSKWQAPEKDYPKAPPLTAEDLKLFGTTREKLNPDITGQQVLPLVQFFLNKQKDPETKKAIPNEATKKMPDELKQDYLFKFLREIRDMKIDKYKALKPYEEKWLGKSLAQLDAITRAYVTRPEKKEPDTKGSDIYEVKTEVQRAITTAERLRALLNSSDFRTNIDKIGQIIDSSLPSVSLVEDRIAKIQDEVSRLGLTKDQVPLILKMDTNSLAHTPAIGTEGIDQIQGEIAAVKNEIAEKGETEESKRKLENLTRRVKEVEGLAGKNLETLYAAVKDYTDTLSAYSGAINKNLSVDIKDTVPELSSLLDLTAELSRQFNRLTQEERFRAFWRGQGDRLIRKEAPAQEPQIAVNASTVAESYSSKLETFHGKGLQDSINELLAFSSDTDAQDSLSNLIHKMLSILEVPSASSLNTHPEKMDFTGNPLGGQGADFAEFNKKIGRIRDIVKKLDVSKKKEQATEIITWLADLPGHIKAVSKKLPKTPKKAFIASFLRKVANELLGAVTPTESPKGVATPSSGFAPGSSPKPGKYVSPSDAGWVLFRERMTKMGKKALKNFFEEPTFVQNFIEQMEREGLNEMLLKGADVPAVDIDKAVESALQKSSGKKGNFENILGTAVMQEATATYDIKKKKKELAEFDNRIKERNEKIVETEKKYLPKLIQFANVLENPGKLPDEIPAEEMKDRAKQEKEHEKGLSFIIDRDTYKKNMNRITIRHLDRGPAPAYKGEGKTYALPSQRAEEYKKLVEDLELKKQQAHQIADEANKLRTEKHLYQTLVDTYDKMITGIPLQEQRVADLRAVAENFKTLEAQKGTIPEEQYKAERAVLLKALDNFGAEGSKVEKILRDEEKSLEQEKRQVKELGPNINEYKQELDRINKRQQEMQQHAPLTTPQKRQKLMGLRVTRAGIGTRADMTVEQRKQRILELDKQIAELEQELGEAPSQPTKEAAIEDTRAPMTEFERALEEKGTKPAPFMKDLPKPKGWNILENFFNESRQELRTLDSLKMKGKDWEEVPEETRKEFSDRIEELDKLIPVLDTYRKQLVEVGDEAIPYRDLVVKFEDTLHRYQEELRKYTNQRDDAVEKSKGLRQELRLLGSLFDLETGKFKGLAPEEVQNMKNLFFRMLYKQMDSYWSSRVGKNIAVFGERDTTWYDNVYRTFRNLAGVRSDRKLMTLLNKYKEVTKSEFPTDASNRPNRIQDLVNRRAEVLKRFQERGVDPARSEYVKELNTRISYLEGQKGQINKIFNEMAAAVEAEMHGKVEKAIKSKITEEQPESKADLDKKVTEATNKVTAMWEDELDALVKTEDVLRQTEDILAKGEAKLNIAKPVEPTPEATPKTAYDKNHRDFDAKILYGSHMQAVLAKMIEKSVTV